MLVHFKSRLKFIILPILMIIISAADILRAIMMLNLSNSEHPNFSVDPNLLEFIPDLFFGLLIGLIYLLANNHREGHWAVHLSRFIFMLVPILLLSGFFIMIAPHYFFEITDVWVYSYIETLFLKQISQSFTFIVTGFMLPFLFYKKVDRKRFHISQWITGIYFLVLIIPFQLIIYLIAVKISAGNPYLYDQYYFEELIICTLFFITGVVFAVLSVNTDEKIHIKFKINVKRLLKYCLPTFLMVLIPFIAIFFIYHSNVTVDSDSFKQLVQNIAVSIAAFADFPAAFDLLFGFLLIYSITAPVKQEQIDAKHSRPDLFGIVPVMLLLVVIIDVLRILMIPQGKIGALSNLSVSLLFGLLMGFAYYRVQKFRGGRFRFSLPRLIFIFLPALLFCIYFAATPNVVLLKEYPLILPLPQNLTYLCLGFMPFFLFTKNRDQNNNLLREWVPSICFGCIFIAMQIAGLYPSLRRHEVNIHSYEAVSLAVPFILGVLFGVLWLVSECGSLQKKLNIRSFFKFSFPLILIGLIPVSVLLSREALLTYSTLYNTETLTMRILSDFAYYTVNMNFSSVMELSAGFLLPLCFSGFLNQQRESLNAS